MAYKATPLSFLSYEECYVSYCEHGPWKFFLQFKQQRDVYIYIQQRLKLYWHTGNLVPSSLFRGSNVLCLIYSNSDAEYYRGLITGAVHQDEVSVYFVDKGTTQKLNINCLWALPPELVDTPILMYRCSLDGLPRVEDSRITNRFLEIVNTHPLMAKIARLDDVKLFKVSMLASGIDILRMIMPPYKETVLTSNSSVVVSFISNEVLYVQPCDDKLDELQARLQVEAESIPVISHPHCNQACAAKFQGNCWYRGVVLEPGNCVKVRFVDYGNVGFVDPDDVKLISRELRSELPAQAVPCILHQVSSQHLKKEYIVQILGATADKVLIVKVTSQIERTIDNIKCQVSEIEAITSDTGLSLNTAINQMIFRDLSRNQPGSFRSLDVRPRWSYGDYNRTDRTLGVGLGEQTKKKPSTITEVVPGPKEEVVRGDFASVKLPVVKIQPKQLMNVCLTWVDKSCFYVTLLENEGLLHNLERKMQVGCQASMKRVNEVISGWLVAASSDNHLWYRARVTRCHGQLIELFLVDSGRDIVVKRDMLQTLPKSVLTVPAQAIKCTLADDTLTPHTLESVKKEIGSNFYVCFEKLMNGIWEGILLEAEQSSLHTTRTILYSSLTFYVYEF